MVRKLAVLGIAALVAATSARADISVKFDNFNSENGAVNALNYTGFAGWTVFQGSVDLHGPPWTLMPPEAGMYVDLNGTTGEAGGIVANEIFAPGDYTVWFDLAGEGRAGITTMTEFKFGDYTETFELPWDQPLTNYTRMITLTDPGTLSFRSLTEGVYGTILDNVEVGRGAPVPEPTTIALFGAGIAAMALRRRRRAA